MKISMYLKALFPAMLVWACQNAEPKVEVQDTAEQEVAEALLARAQGIFKALPESPGLNSAKAQLGKRLYFETALSANGQMSCNSCHDVKRFGVDREPTSPGHEGKRGDRNSPTVFNASLHIAQFWDGRAADLSEQAKGPILNPIEMGIKDEKTAEARIKAIAEYGPLFAEAFPENPVVSYQNIADAIAEYEKALITPGRFDRYINGDIGALTADEQAGLQAFFDAGCITCHMGAGLGGNMFQKFGLMNGPYWEYTGSTKHDKGKAEVSQKPEDEFMFKVPSLRNVSQTYPYFHDGSVASLEDACRIMGKTQLNKDLSDEEVGKIVAFLKSLDGELPVEALPEA